MRYEYIVCFDDVLRQEYGLAKEFFYNLLREPIRQATGLNIGSCPTFRHYEHNLKPTFSLERFLSFFNSSWPANYHEIPPRAQTYLLENLHPKTLIVSYEMPPWLEKFCVAENIDFIDIRISPLRFARDLYICLKSNNVNFMKKFQKKEVLQEEFLLEASLMTAYGRYKPQPSLEDNALIYVGQTAKDASLVDAKGAFISIEHIDTRQSFHHQNIYYLPHPYAKDHAKKEFETLKTLCKRISFLDENIYNLLCFSGSLEFIAISSSVLQEAPYFGKKGTFLHGPICPLSGKNRYIQLHAQTIMQPIFWHNLLTPSAPKPKLKKLPLLQPNMLRQLHNAWWGYARFVSEFRYIDKEAFWLSGGNTLKQEIDSLSQRIAP